MRVVRRFAVIGRVQNVGFRFFVWRRAEALGLDGWVRNRREGSVEALAGGEPEQLDLFYEQLRAGPRWARVDQVTVVEEDASAVAPESGFDVRREG